MPENVLNGKTIVILAADGVEEVEYRDPKTAVEAAGARTVTVSLESGTIQAMNADINRGSAIPVDAVIDDVSVEDYDGLILPGGVANPDKLRASDAVITFLRGWFAAGKPVAAICHAPWSLVEADLVRDRTLTSFPSLRTDITNAGGNVVDEEVVVDGNLVTSRDPDDLPAFCAAAVEHFAAG